MCIEFFGEKILTTGLMIRVKKDTLLNDKNKGKVNV